MSSPQGFPGASNTVSSPPYAQRSELGKVFLVGAGPGDPKLITLRGMESLAAADIVLYDGLANPQLLDWASQAECICVGKHGQIPVWTQERICEAMLSYAQKGKTVVRLKGGDPAVFARTAEELEALSDGGIPFEVVPGITAALAAASYIGVPITHREHASAVAFVTGQQRASGVPQDIDWHALAAFQGTLVFYMGVTTVEEWTGRLIAAGKSPATPAAIVRRCTWSDQTVIRTELAAVSKQLTPASKFRPPVIVIVGEVARLGANFDWFAARPLHGAGILITRPESQSRELGQALTELGADVYYQPAIEVDPAPALEQVQKWISEAAGQRSPAQRSLAPRFTGITFSSANGVRELCNFIFESIGADGRAFANLQIAAVGPATARELRDFGLRADIVAQSEFSAQGLLEELPSKLEGQHWLVTQTNRSRPTLADGLRAKGATVETLQVYSAEPVKTWRPSVTEALKRGRIHYCTVTSTLVAEAMYGLLGEQHKTIVPVSLSPQISEELELNLNWSAGITAESASDAALISALVELHSQK